MRSSALRWRLPLAVVALVLLAIGYLPIAMPLADETSTLGDPNGPPDYSVPAVAAGDTATHPIGPIGNGTVVTQDFPSGGTGITSLSLFLGASQPINRGTMKVTLQIQENGQWTPIATQTIDERRLKDKRFSTLSFAPPLAVTRGQIIRIALAADTGADTGVTWYANPSWDKPGFTLFVDREPQQGAGIFHASYAQATGRVFQMLGPIWNRLTLFLGPLWRVTLAVGALGLIGSIVVAAYIFVT